MSEFIQLQSKSSTVSIARADLVRASKVFAHIDATNDEPIAEWPLHDFSQSCLEQFRDFVSSFKDIVDVKFPTQLHSDQLYDHIEHKPMADFLLEKSNAEFLELFLLANYIECSLLFQLCCVRLGCEMMRRAPVGQLALPSDTFVNRHIDTLHKTQDTMA